MLVRYEVDGASHSFDTAEAEDLSAMCREVEGHLRSTHPELSGRPYLAERVADGLLNALAGDADDVDLGDLS